MKKFYQNILILLILLILYLIIISLLRYTQRHNNVDMKNQLRSFSAWQAFSPPLNYEEQDLISNFQSYQNDLNNINNNKIDPNKLLRVANYASKINNNFIETKFSNKLLRLNINVLPLQRDYLNTTLLQSIYVEMNCGNYENARYKAQRLINNSNLLRPMERSLTYGRKILKLTKNNLYDVDKNLIKVLNDISYYDDFLNETNNKKTLLAMLESNSNIDFVPYYIYDVLENNLTSAQKKLQLWQDFEKKYKENIFLDEAVYNQFLYSVKSQEKLFEKKKNLYKAFSKLFYRKALLFLERFPKSYLIDDVLYLTIIFSVFEDNFNEFKKNYNLLKQNRPNSPYLNIIENKYFNQENGFDYRIFISDTINLSTTMSFKEYSKNIPFDENYFWKLKRELFKYEGEKYPSQTIETIIWNIVQRNRRSLWKK